MPLPLGNIFGLILWVGMPFVFYGLVWSLVLLYARRQSTPSGAIGVIAFLAMVLAGALVLKVWQIVPDNRHAIAVAYLFWTASVSSAALGVYLVLILRRRRESEVTRLPRS